MKIIPSALLINDYENVSKICNQTGETFLLKTNNVNDLVIMSLDAYNKQQTIIELKEKLIDAEYGKKYSLKQLDDSLRKLLF